MSEIQKCLKCGNASCCGRCCLTITTLNQTITELREGLRKISSRPVKCDYALHSGVSVNIARDLLAKTEQPEREK